MEKIIVVNRNLRKKVALIEFENSIELRKFLEKNKKHDDYKYYTSTYYEKLMRNILVP